MEYFEAGQRRSSGCVSWRHGHPAWHGLPGGPGRECDAPGDRDLSAPGWLLPGAAVEDGKNLLLGLAQQVLGLLRLVVGVAEDFGAGQV